MNESIAHHEAGHVLVASLRGGRVLSCALECESTDRGETVVHWPPTSDRAQRTEARCAVALAGPVAELLEEGAELEFPRVEEWRADWTEAWSAAQTVAPEAGPRLLYLADVFERVVALLSRPEHTETVAQLVDHLLAEEHLDEGQIQQIVDRWKG